MSKKIFGYELVMDLFECDIGVISSSKKLKEYTDELIEKNIELENNVDHLIHQQTSS